MKILTSEQIRVGMVLAIVNDQETPEAAKAVRCDSNDNDINYRIIRIIKTENYYSAIYSKRGQTMMFEKNHPWCIDDEHDLRSAVLVARVLNNQPTGEAT